MDAAMQATFKAFVSSLLSGSETFLSPPANHRASLEQQLLGRCIDEPRWPWQAGDGALEVDEARKSRQEARYVPDPPQPPLANGRRCFRFRSFPPLHGGAFAKPSTTRSQGRRSSEGDGPPVRRLSLGDRTLSMAFMPRQSQFIMALTHTPRQLLQCAISGSRQSMAAAFLERASSLPRGPSFAASAATTDFVPFGASLRRNSLNEGWKALAPQLSTRLSLTTGVSAASLLPTVSGLNQTQAGDRALEMDLVIKQRAALKQLLTPLLSDHSSEFDSLAQEHIETGLLSVQTGTSGWDLLHALQEAALKGSGERTLSAASFAAVVGMLDAILNAAAQKEDFHSVLMALEAAEQLFCKRTNGVLESCLNGLRGSAVLYCSWVWVGAFSAASLSGHDRDSWQSLAERFANLMAAAGLDDEPAWAMLLQLHNSKKPNARAVEDLAGARKAAALAQMAEQARQEHLVLDHANDYGGWEAALRSTYPAQQPHALTPEAFQRLNTVDLTPLEWRELPGHSSAVRCLVAVGGVVASASTDDHRDAAVRFWSSPTSRWQVCGVTSLLENSEVTALGLISQGLQCAVGLSNGSVSILSTTSGQQLGRWRAHGLHVACIAADGPVSSAFLSGGEDGRAALWDLRTKEACVLTLAGHAQGVLAAHFEGRAAPAVTSSKDGSCRVWDLRTSSTPLHVLRGHKDWVGALEVAEGVLASGSYDGGICTWSLADGRRLATLTGHRGRVTSLCLLSNCGKAQLASGSEDGTVRIWNSEYGQWQLLSLHDCPASVLRAAPDRAAGPCCLWTGGADGSFAAWEYSSKDVGDELAFSDLAGDGDQEGFSLVAYTSGSTQVSCMTADALSEVLYTGCRNGDLRAYSWS